MKAVKKDHPENDDTASLYGAEALRKWMIAQGYPARRSVGRRKSEETLAKEASKENVVPIDQVRDLKNEFCPVDWRYVARDLGVGKAHIYNILRGEYKIGKQMRERMDELSLLKNIQRNRKLTKSNLDYIDKCIADVSPDFALIVKLYWQREVTKEDLERIDERLKDSQKIIP